MKLDIECVFVFKIVVFRIHIGKNFCIEKLSKRVTNVWTGESCENCSVCHKKNENSFLFSDMFIVST